MRRHHTILITTLLFLSLSLGGTLAWSASRGGSVTTKFDNLAGNAHFTVTSKLDRKWSVGALDKNKRRALSGGSVRGCVIASAGYNAFAGSPNTRSSVRSFLKSVINTSSSPSAGRVSGQPLAGWGVVQDRAQRRFHAVVAVNTVERGESGQDVGYRAFEVIGSYGITGSRAQRARCDREASALIRSLRTTMRTSKVRVREGLPIR